MADWPPRPKRPAPGLADDVLDGIEADQGREALEDFLLSLPEEDEYEDGPTEGADEPGDPTSPDDGEWNDEEE